MNTSADRGSLRASILIVSYNTCPLTLACLQSIYARTEREDIEVIVVDNASSDGSPDSIEERFPQVELIRSQENLGFGRANNLAAACAKGRHLILLNPDTEVHEGAIDHVLEYADEHAEAGIVGGRTLNADGSLNPSSCWGAPSLWSVFCRATLLSSVFPRTRLFDPTSLGRWARDTEREVDIVSGCFLCIQRPLWDRLAGFDERFFMYGEDVDLSLRARQLGFKPRITPRATIKHVGAASERIKEDKLVRLLRAQREVQRIHWSPLAARIGLAIGTAGTALRAAGARAMNLLGSQGAASRAWPGVWNRRQEWR